MNKGKIVEIIGPVLDVEFPPGKLPKIYNAVHITREDGSVIIAEVAQHLGENAVRAVAMESTDGVVRGMRPGPVGSSRDLWILAGISVLLGVAAWSLFARFTVDDAFIAYRHAR